MDGTALQDKVSRGLGRAALKLGVPFTVYRPTGPLPPCNSQNKVITLFAQMTHGRSGSNPPTTLATPFWSGVYDTSYTDPGDYLVGRNATFFVAAQPDNQPAQCVLTNSLVSLTRQIVPSVAGYAGLTTTTGTVILEAWPASLLRSAAHGASSSKSLGELGGFLLLLPQLPIVPKPGDLIADDLDNTYVVTSSQSSISGWCLSVRQTSA